MASVTPSALRSPDGRTEPRRAAAGGRQARAGARHLARRGRRPRGLGARPGGLPAHRQGLGGRLHRAARRRQVDADRGADQAPPRARAAGGGAVDRPQLAVPRRRAARGPDPAVRALPRPGRVHPLDGDPRRARRAGRGGAPGRAADGRRRQGRRVPGDGRRRPGRGRRDRPRGLDRARADPRLGRLDPGAQGRCDGDPGRHRRQQVRPPADRHDGARDQGRAQPRPAGGLGGADRQDRGGARGRRRGAGGEGWPSTARTWRPRGRCPSAGGAT